MRTKKLLILSISVIWLLTIGLWTNTVNGQQLTISSLPMNVQSVWKSDNFFHIEAEYPQFEMAATDFNQKISDLIAGKISNFEKESRDNWKARLKTLPAGEPVPENPETPFVFIASWQPTQLNNKYLSFVIKVYYFTGGAHGNEEIYAFNYDMAKKKEIHIDDFLGSSQKALEKISKMSTHDIIGQLQSMGWEVDRLKEMVDQGTEPVFKNFKDFNFNSNSLIIYFQRYQVAPGAAGSLTVMIPKTTLEENSIKSDYLE